MAKKKKNRDPRARKRKTAKESRNEILKRGRCSETGQFGGTGHSAQIRRQTGGDYNQAVVDWRKSLQHGPGIGPTN